MNIEVAPGPRRMLRYNDAVLYCAFCRHGDHNDWRLPTSAELLEHVSTRGWSENDRAYSGLQYILDHVTPVRDIC
jgi:hypothetical protein